MCDYRRVECGVQCSSFTTQSGKGCPRLSTHSHTTLPSYSYSSSFTTSSASATHFSNFFFSLFFSFFSFFSFFFIFNVISRSQNPNSVAFAWTRCVFEFGRLRHWGSGHELGDCLQINDFRLSSFHFCS